MSGSFDIAAISTSDGLPDNAARKVNGNFLSLVKKVSDVESSMQAKVKRVESRLGEAENKIKELEGRVAELEGASSPEVPSEGA